MGIWNYASYYYINLMPVYQDKQNLTWYVKCRYQDYTGARKQKTKRGFRLRRDAVQWEQNFLANLQREPSILFSDLAAEYLKDMTANRKASTCHSARWIVKQWLLPAFGSKPVDQITPADVRQWENSINTATGKTGRPLSTNYKRNIVGYLSGIFTYAVKFYGLSRNPVPVAGMNVGKVTKSMAFWTPEQFSQFVTTYNDPDEYLAAIMVLYWTGIRCGELLALTVADVLPDRIRVNKTYTVVDGSQIVTTPKTERSNREIFINDELKAVLDRQKHRLYGSKPTDRLFPFNRVTLYKHFVKHTDAAGLPRIRLHDLRHSHASLLINSGIDPLTVSERLGHESAATTLRTYSHLFPSKQAELVSRLSEMWGQNGVNEDKKT